MPLFLQPLLLIGFLWTPIPIVGHVAATQQFADTSTSARQFLHAQLLATPGGAPASPATSASIGASTMATKRSDYLQVTNISKHDTAYASVSSSLLPETLPLAHVREELSYGVQEIQQLLRENVREELSGDIQEIQQLLHESSQAEGLAFERENQRKNRSTPLMKRATADIHDVNSAIAGLSPLAAGRPVMPPPVALALRWSLKPQDSPTNDKLEEGRLGNSNVLEPNRWSKPSPAPKSSAKSSPSPKSAPSPKSSPSNKKKSSSNQKECEGKDEQCGSKSQPDVLLGAVGLAVGTSFLCCFWCCCCGGGLGGSTEEGEKSLGPEGMDELHEVWVMSARGDQADAR